MIRFWRDLIVLCVSAAPQSTRHSSARLTILLHTHQRSLNATWLNARRSHIHGLLAQPSHLLANFILFIFAYKYLYVPISPGDLPPAAQRCHCCHFCHSLHVHWPLRSLPLSDGHWKLTALKRLSFCLPLRCLLLFAFHCPKRWLCDYLHMCVLQA